MLPIPSIRSTSITSRNEKPSNNVGEQAAPPEKRREGAAHGKRQTTGYPEREITLEVLEPYDGKLSRTVLRGERGRKAPALPGAERNKDDHTGSQS